MNSLISPHQSHQKEKTRLGFCVPHRAPVLFHRVFFASLDTPQFFNPHSIIIFPCCYSLTRFRVWFLMGGVVGCIERGWCRLQNKVCCVVSGALVVHHSNSNWPNTAIGKMKKPEHLLCHLQTAHNPTNPTSFPIAFPHFIHWDSQNDHKLHPSKGNRFHRCF